MASTPNFNWSTPDNTGLVKNGALDIRTLGNAIDASLVDLKGGTTGQVLAKASATDMDFSWVANGGGGGSYTWTSYTPTLTNLTIGNGTRTFVYAQIDKVIMVRGEIVLGSTSSVTGQIGISLPVTSAGSIYLPDFTVEMFNSGTGIAYPGAGSIYSSAINLTAFNASSTYLTKAATSSTVPFTFATGNTITVVGFYQAA